MISIGDRVLIFCLAATAGLAFGALDPANADSPATSTKSNTQSESRSTTSSATKSLTQATTKTGTQTASKSATQGATKAGAQHAPTTAAHPSPKGGSKPIVMDFGAAWCVPCKEFAPTFAKVKAEYQNKADFVSIDAATPDGEATAEKFSVAEFPTLVITDAKGKVIFRSHGKVDEKMLVTEVTKVVGK